MRRAASVLAVAVLVIGSISVSVAAADEVGTIADVRVERDLTYRRVGGEDVKLDAFVPVGDGFRPAVVVIFGGGWVEGSKALSAPMAEALADRGYVAFAIDYRLAPAHPYPAAVDDVRASVEWVRNHAFDFGVDPGRIAAIGGSAGGHLSALLATLGQGPHDRDARLTAAVSWAGPMDLHLDEFPPESHPYLEAFLDCVGRPCDEAAVVAASPISHVDQSDAPILLIQGNEDLLVPPDQAERMAASLDRAGVRHELVIVPAGHDSRLWPFVFEPTYDFLRRELGGVEPAPPGAIGNGGGGGYVAPVIAVVIAGLAIGALAVVARRREQVRY